MNIPIGSIVKLKNGPDVVYSRAWVGSQAKVCDSKVEDGFNLLYLQWDKEDWRYNGQSDGWSFADHFELKSLPHSKPKESETVISAKSGKLTKYNKSLIERETQVDRQTEEYIEELEHAFQDASGSEGFLILSVERVRGKKGVSSFIPSVHAGFYSSAARASLGVLLSNVLINEHEDLINQTLQREDEDS